MKPFAFRAEVALDLRRRQEEDAERAVAAAQIARQQAAEALAAAEAALADAARRMADEERRAADVARAVWHRNWMRYQRQEIARWRELLAAREAAVAAAIRAAQEARRKRRSLERLRDRAWADYQSALGREEQKALDDLGTLRYVHRNAASQGG